MCIRDRPGTIRDPLDATGEDDEASDETSEVCSSDGDTDEGNKESTSSVEQPAEKKSQLHLNQYETPLGLDPTCVPDFVQHVSSFKAKLDLVQDAVKKMRSAEMAADNIGAARPDTSDASQSADASNATAQAAAEEECYRAVVDLQEVAQKLDKHKFQEKAKLLDNVDNKAMFVNAAGYVSSRMSVCVRRTARLESVSS